MSVRLQRFNEHRAMPWKNGLGVTREVIACLQGGDTSRFLWRISMATVTGSGPFSVFPGIDRTIAVMTGDGMRLTVDGHAQPPLTTASNPYAFSGDAAVYADSLGGETLDLNVMTERGCWHHEMQRITLDREVNLSIDADLAAIAFAGRTKARVGDEIVAADAGDVLLGLEGGTQVSLLSAPSSTVAFVILLIAQPLI